METIPRDVVQFHLVPLIDLLDFISLFSASKSLHQLSKDEVGFPLRVLMFQEHLEILLEQSILSLEV